MKKLLPPRQTHTASNAYLWRDFVPTRGRESKYVLDLFDAGEADWRFRDLIYGYLSGFPYCCVKFFVTEWQPFFETHSILMPGGGKDPSVASVLSRALWPQPYHVGYVMCPACRITRNAAEFQAFTWLARKIQLKELTDVRPINPTGDRRVLLGATPALSHA